MTFECRRNLRASAKHEKGESRVDLRYLCFVPNWRAVAR